MPTIDAWISIQIADACQFTSGGAPLGAAKVWIQLREIANAAVEHFASRPPSRPVSGLVLVVFIVKSRLLDEQIFMVAQINCMFGQLVYLAKLRNSQVVGHSDVEGVGKASHEVIQEAHRQVFTQWLTLSLEEQLRDFEQFMDSAEDSGDADDIKRTFSEHNVRSTLVPVAAPRAEGQLFEIELSEVMKLTFGDAVAQAGGTLVAPKQHHN